ncbi:DHH family phosphoesterase [[Clostridium] fimetarium]|uniref:NanoRNase/pAp phosphatase, hydrolyzes c-di-AMP and oligoRNAs n=1 Tax=[Clostridium] fimetarium TaxID=99656 RepID=A0A1I0MSU5_9FIRM|nr:DHH family phosphoesterase [[Clostridium] fimetarium]SEV91260.1 nanoRNase/pAp phosphatase, hydrolyzes c-di-AMP and oligoRNAs [[Clostridium] fimetarium]
MTKLEEIVKCISGNHIYIQTHNFPDPDAIASAYGIQKLLKCKNIDSTICYYGKIDRSSTCKMVSQLGIEIVNMDDMDDIRTLNSEDMIILVDGQKGNSNIINIPGVEIICIDHHKTYDKEKINYLYSDIRPDVGACASIIAEYFYESQIEIDKNLATAFMFAIKVDTANMSRGVSDLDLEMFYKLYKLCDRDIIKSLEMGTIQFDDLHAYVNAISSIKVYNNISFANTGAGCPEALIATISDFMLALDEVNLSVVYSEKEDGIRLSIRSQKQYDAGLIATKALLGIGNGGGHELMAGGFVPSQQGIDTNTLISDLEKRFLDTVYELYAK